MYSGWLSVVYQVLPAMEVLAVFAVLYVFT